MHINQTAKLNNIPHDQRSAGVIWCNKCDTRITVMAISKDVPNFNSLLIKNCFVCGTDDIEFDSTLNKGVSVQ